MVVGKAGSGRGGKFWNVLYIGFAETARIENKFGTVYGYIGGHRVRRMYIYSAAAVYSSWKVGASGGVFGIGYLWTFVWCPGCGAGLDFKIHGLS